MNSSWNGRGSWHHSWGKDRWEQQASQWDGKQWLKEPIGRQQEGTGAFLTFLCVLGSELINQHLAMLIFVLLSAVSVQAAVLLQVEAGREGWNPSRGRRQRQRNRHRERAIRDKKGQSSTEACRCQGASFWHLCLIVIVPAAPSGGYRNVRPKRAQVQIIRIRIRNYINRRLSNPIHCISRTFLSTLTTY